MEVQKCCSESFENDRVYICKEKLPMFLQCCIEDITRKQSFITHNIETKQILTKGGNYLAFLYEIDIKGTTKDGDKEINLFVKNITPVHSMDEFFSVSKAYLTEVYFYKELQNVFTRLQDIAGIPLEDRYKHVRGFDESSSEAIILENVAKKGFKTLDRLKMVPLKFMELSVQQLAKFHALGFAIEKKMPDYFQNTLSKLSYPISFNDNYEKFMKDLMDISIKNMEDGPLKKKAETFAQSYFNIFAQYFNDETVTRTLCHGDFRLNNILARHENGEITEVIPVDYQIIHYGCPVLDLVYLIYGCTDRQFRRSHMKDLIDLYHDAMKNFLKYFEIDISIVYPRKELDSYLKKVADYPLIIALAFFTFYFAPEDNIPDICEDVAKMSVKLDPQYIRRIKEIIEHLEGSAVI